MQPKFRLCGVKQHQHEIPLIEMRMKMCASKYQTVKYVISLGKAHQSSRKIAPKHNNKAKNCTTEEKIAPKKTITIKLQMKKG